MKTEPVREIDLGEQMMCIKISHSGKYFALGSVSGELWLFSLPDCEFIGKSHGHSREVSGLNWSPDDKQIISKWKFIGRCTKMFDSSLKSFIHILDTGSLSKMEIPKIKF